MGTKAGIDDLCAAAVLEEIQNGAREGQGAEEGANSQIKVVEVDAFSSVHDMIHAAILSYGQNASLRQVYAACVARGRIAYKRAGGSRLITNNDHWKSQIRHALYTCDRFRRAPEDNDLWQVSPAWKATKPQTVKVLIRTDVEGSVGNDDPPAAAQPARRGARGKVPPALGPPLPAIPQKKRRSHLAKRVREDTVGLGWLQERAVSPATASSHQLDECNFSPVPTGYHPMAFGSPSAVETSAFVSSYLDQWQRAARHFNMQAFSMSCNDRATLTHLGSEAVTGPCLTRDGSAEAESPALCKPLYALRSHTKPPAPPGFGDNPDPVAERAAREAHAATSGPLKKRLKAAAKAAEMAANVSTAETTSEITNLSSEQTRMSLGFAWSTPPPRVRMKQEEQGERTLWRPRATTPPSFLSSLAAGRRGQEMSVSPSAGSGKFLQGSPLSTYDSFRSDSCFQPIPSALSLLEPHSAQTAVPYAPYTPTPSPAFPGLPFGAEVREGGDETDEAGGKRLLRSDRAALAADLREGGAFDRTR